MDSSIPSEPDSLPGFMPDPGAAEISAFVLLPGTNVLISVADHSGRECRYIQQLVSELDIRFHVNSAVVLQYADFVTFCTEHHSYGLLKQRLAYKPQLPAKAFQLMQCTHLQFVQHFFQVIWNRLDTLAFFTIHVIHPLLSNHFDCELYRSRRGRAIHQPALRQ